VDLRAAALLLAVATGFSGLAPEVAWQRVLAALFEVQARVDPIPVETARRHADLYARHYHHAAPFPRAALERIWQRCEADASQAQRCAEARDESESAAGVAGGERRGMARQGAAAR
jgi:hypothetical protein